jgi:hypothetical protein
MEKYSGNSLLIFSSILLAIPGILIILFHHNKYLGLSMILVSVSSIVYHSTGNLIARHIDESIRNFFGAIFSIYAILIGNMWPIIYGAIAILGYQNNQINQINKNINHALFVHMPVFLGFSAFLLN